MDPRDHWYTRPDVERVRSEWTYLGPHALIAGLAVTYLKPGSHNRVLELGCSDGLLAKRILKTVSAQVELETDDRPFVHEYVGVDLSPMALENARTRLPAETGTKWVQADLNEELPDLGQFDLVLVANFLALLPNGVMRETLTRRAFERYVSRSGVMIMVSYLTNPEHRSFHGDWPVHQRRASGTLITNEIGGDGGPAEFVYRFDVVENAPMRYSEPMLWGG